MPRHGPALEIFEESTTLKKYETKLQYYAKSGLDLTLDAQAWLGLGNIK